MSVRAKPTASYGEVDIDQAHAGEPDQVAPVLGQGVVAEPLHDAQPRAWEQGLGEDVRRHQGLHRGDVGDLGFAKLQHADLDAAA